MAERRFHLVDVFADGPVSGNPLAVVVDSDGLTTDGMQDLTRWLGFSESTFLGKPSTPGADYSVRIFTLSHELPFAGHPTIGSAYVWRSVTGQESHNLVQECGVGLVNLRVEADTLGFAAPSLIRDGPVDTSLMAHVVDFLGVTPDQVVDAKWVANGPMWIGVHLVDAETVLGLAPDISRYGADEILHVGVIGAYPAGSDPIFEVRAFFDDGRGVLREDPVTGSLNASLAQWVVGSGLADPPYTVRQGTALGRSGLVSVSGSVDELWISGRVAPLVTGVIDY